jgi:phage terminase large subunit-like protein
MSTLIVPELEREGDEWPTLGPAICEWAEDNLIFGPGDLHGEPYRFDPEKRALVYRAYEVYPDDHELAGRRRFRRVAWSLQKGSAKTELAAIIAACELHHKAPVRTIAWRNGVPEGSSVRDPYIPLVAYTEEQTEDLAYGALRAILSDSRVAKDFDIGAERIIRVGNPVAIAMPLAAAPDSRDGARTTFSHKDETHRWTLLKLKNAAKAMLANLPKRFLADAWDLETTTAYSPGEGSVAEDTMEYAKNVADGKRTDSKLFYFHREASDEHDISTREGLRAAVIEAAGPMAAWKDVDGICDQFDDPTADHPYLERVWLNRRVQTSAQAFNSTTWANLKRGDYAIKPGAPCVAGFDGSVSEDSTGLCLTEIATGHQVMLGKWEKPPKSVDWVVPGEDVDSMVTFMFQTYKIWVMYADPYWWDGWISTWRGRYADKVKVWSTAEYVKMAKSLQAYKNAQENGDISHDGDPDFAAHIGHAVKQEINHLDDQGKKMWIIRKERQGSPLKIDFAMAACLANQARLDAIADGMLHRGGKARVTMLTT